MIPKITGQLVGAAQTVKQVQSLSAHIHAELYRTVERLGHALERSVKKKLSGPVLGLLPSGFPGVRGLLRNSINTKITDTGTSITATVGTSLAVVPYARIHEYGGIIVPKKAPYLVFKTYDGAWHKVKQVKMPERSYLRSSLNEMRPTIEQQIQLALQRAAKKSGIVKK